MLTKKKRDYAKAREAGETIKNAAIAAGCPAKTAAQAGSRMEKDADVLAARARMNGQKPSPPKKAARKPATIKSESVKSPPKVPGWVEDPAEYLTKVMNDSGEDPKLRADAAKALLPYKHQKPGLQGKKESKADAAKDASLKGKFKPRLVK